MTFGLLYKEPDIMVSAPTVTRHLILGSVTECLHLGSVTECLHAMLGDITLKRPQAQNLAQCTCHWRSDRP
jgi:hypothetical protein